MFIGNSEPELVPDPPEYIKLLRRAYEERKKGNGDEAEIITAEAVEILKENVPAGSYKLAWICSCGQLLDMNIKLDNAPDALWISQFFAPHRAAKHELKKVI